jgi:branched-chain amino acid transport system permease protein
MRRLSLTRGTHEHQVIKYAGLVAVIVIAWMLPQELSPYRVFQFSLVLVYAVAVLGLNLLTGFNGQISLGHSFFFAIGAYTTAILMKDYEWPYLLTLPLAFVITFVLGFLFGIPALRLEGLYLALVTLALAIVAPPFIKRFDDLTGGSQGIVLRKPTAPEWSGLAGDQWRYYVALGVVVIMFVVARNLVRGRVGRAIMAIRDNELAAETMGINVAAYKAMTFAYSAAYAGVAGGVFSLIVGFVSPDSFTVVLAIALLSAMVVGGLATIGGAIAGALFIRFVPVYAAEINDAIAGVIYGASLILVMLVMPGGFMGLLRRLRSLVVVIKEPGGAEVKAGADAMVTSPAFEAGRMTDVSGEEELSEGGPATVAGPEQ